MFGLGTIPILLAMSLVGNLVGAKTKTFFNKLIPVGAVVLAVLIILRGLSLGIPYVSPKIVVDQTGEQKVECCHPSDEN